MKYYSYCVSWILTLYQIFHLSTPPDHIDGLRDIIYLGHEKIGMAGIFIDDPTLGVIVFRGSQTFDDFVSDLKSLFQVPFFHNDTLQVGRGYMDRYMEIRPVIHSLVQKNMWNVTRWLWTGHSLGAGMIPLCLLDLAPIVDSIYIFGSPRTGNVAFARMIDPYSEFFTFINMNDLIPFMPIGFSTCGMPIAFLSLVNDTLEDNHSMFTYGRYHPDRSI